LLRESGRGGAEGCEIESKNQYTRAAAACACARDWQCALISMPHAQHMALPQMINRNQNDDLYLEQSD
jgi:hypothetical protein